GGKAFIHNTKMLSAMTHMVTGKWTARPVASAALRYGLAFASVAVALGLARIFYTFICLSRLPHLRYPQSRLRFGTAALSLALWLRCSLRLSVTSIGLKSVRCLAFFMILCL